MPAGTLKVRASTSQVALGMRTVPLAAWRATTALARNFGQLMEREGKEIDYDHFAGYINARVLIEGLKGAGRTPTPESLIQSMEKLGRLDLGGYDMRFSPQNHHGSNFVEITVVGPRGNFIR